MFSVANWRKASQTPPVKAASLSAAAAKVATAACATGGGFRIEVGGGGGAVEIYPYALDKRKGYYSYY